MIECSNVDENKKISVPLFLMIRSFHSSPKSLSPAFLHQIGRQIYFNLSHVRCFVLCAISDDETIGVDVGKTATAPMGIMKQFFHPEEIPYVESTPILEQDLYFYNIWTRKETYVKQLGAGLVLNLSVYNTLSPSFPSDLKTWRHDNYICCVCSSSIYRINIQYLSECNIPNFYVNLDNST